MEFLAAARSASWAALLLCVAAAVAGRKRIFFWLWRVMHGPTHERLAPLRATVLAPRTLPPNAVAMELGPAFGRALGELRAAAANGILSRLYLAEPNTCFHAALLASAAAAGVPASAVTLLPRSAASLPEVPDASVHAVFCQLVLCSVSNQAAVLAEVRRVLAPGGRLIFIEHVKAPASAPLAARVQQWVIERTGVWGYCGDGCHVARDTAAAVAAAGPWASLEMHSAQLPHVPAGLSPHAWGVAVK